MYARHVICVYMYIYIYTHVDPIAIRGKGNYIQHIIGLCSTTGRYSTRYAKYAKCIDNSWASFWSPIGCRRELRKKNDHNSTWNCGPRLFGVFKNMHNHQI